MTYLVGIDIGGTFTDCAIVDRAGKLLTTKVPSTPQDFARYEWTSTNAATA